MATCREPLGREPFGSERLDMSFRPEPFGSERLDMSSSTCLKAELLGAERPQGRTSGRVWELERVQGAGERN
jgi:hypothetical protein